MDARIVCSKTAKLRHMCYWRHNAEDHHWKKKHPWTLWTLWIFTAKVVFLESCFCVQIVKQPKSDINVVEGEPIELDCQFNTAVHCVWFKNDSHVKIVGRYSFKDQHGSQTSSEDCSIDISTSTLYDRGQWRCSNMADSTGNSVITSSTSCVRIEERKVVVNPQSLNARRGANVTLNCKFNTKVKCLWDINGNPKISRGNYVYFQDSGRETKDCSITLINIEKSKHQGNWTCSSKATDFTMGATSTIAHINIEDPNIVVEPPSQIMANQNDRVNLNCRFDMAVNCHWTINGASPTLDLINYLHNNGRSTEDCSIKIEEFNENYVGNWTCEDADDHAIASRAVALELGKSQEKPSCQCEYVKLDRHQNVLSRALKTPDDDVYATCCCHGSLSKPHLHWELLTNSRSSKINTSHVDRMVNHNGIWKYSLSLTCREYEKLLSKNGNFTLLCVASQPEFEVKLQYGLESPCANSAKSSVGASSECAICNASSSGYIASVVILIIIIISVVILLLNQKYNWINRLSFRKPSKKDPAVRWSLKRKGSNEHCEYRRPTNISDS